MTTLNIREQPNLNFIHFRSFLACSFG